MSSPATILNEVIDKGATFYREVQLFTDSAKTIPMNLTDKTVRSTLMNLKGDLVASFSGTVTDTLNGKLVWLMSRTLTSTLNPNLIYVYSIDLDDADGVTTDRAMEGRITINCGQPAPVTVP